MNFYVILLKFNNLLITKRLRCLILVLILNTFLVFSKGSFASMFGLYVGGGYPFVFDNFKETYNFGKYYSDFGLCYGLKVNNFWFECGVEYEHQVSVTKYEVSGKMERMMYDTQGKEILFHYEFNKAVDWQNFDIINVPIVFGYYNSGFYIGTGPKIGIGFNLVNKSDLYYTTSATYKQYLEDFVDMPNHYYSTYKESCKKKLLQNLNLGAIVEVGYDFWELMNSNYRNYTSLKLSLFAEYTYFNLKSDYTSLLLYEIDEVNPSIIRLLPFYYVKASNDSRESLFHSVIVGVKLSWMINFPYKNCKNCNMWKKPRRFL